MHEPHPSADEAASAEGSLPATTSSSSDLISPDAVPPILSHDAPYDPQVAVLICRFIAEEGLSESRAGMYAGVHQSTLHRWRKTAPNFVPLLVAAQRAHLEKKRTLHA